MELVRSILPARPHPQSLSEPKGLTEPHRASLSLRAEEDGAHARTAASTLTLNLTLTLTLTSNHAEEDGARARAAAFTEPHMLPTPECNDASWPRFAVSGRLHVVHVHVYRVAWASRRFCAMEMHLSRCEMHLSRCTFACDRGNRAVWGHVTRLNRTLNRTAEGSR